MCAQINANLSPYEGQLGFENLPPGWYRAKVAESTIKEGPKGNYIQWKMQIVGKPNNVWDNMSMSNEISMKRLKGLAIACGHPNPNFIADTEELHGKECMVRLKIEEDPDGKYEPKNVISAFKPVENGQPAFTPGVNTPSPTSAPAPAASKQQPKMPWDRA
jgi:hypothetical protein